VSPSCARSGSGREMPKKELRRYYQWFMDVLPERIKELAAAVRETPGFESWQPDFTPASLDALGQWFAGQVETRSRTQGELQAIRDRLVFPMDIPAEELTNRTFSLAMDIGMYFSQVLMKNYRPSNGNSHLATKGSLIMANHVSSDLARCLRTRCVSGMSSPTG
jgi:hypothetical protein